MTDLETLYQWEIDAADAGMGRHAEVFRNARRYLANREREVATFAELTKKGIHAPLTPEEHRCAYDAAADRLLEGGE